MTQRLIRPNYPRQKAKEDQLFDGIWLRWSALTLAEKVVCANIVLIPVWWFVGLTNYMPLFLSFGIVFYDWRRYERVRLKRPSWAVIALFAFFAYGYIDNIFISLDAYPSIDIPPGLELNPNSLIKGLFSFAIPFLVWYIQSNKIRVRLEVVVWAGSVTIIQMLLGWLTIQFAFPGIIENPPRTLYAMLTGKGRFNPEDVNGWGNYLVFYGFYNNEVGRIRFFFAHYQVAAGFLGLVGLMALDIKNRVWSCLILAGCIFLLMLTGARSVWLALPVALFIRFFLTLVKLRLIALVFAVLAIFSFATLSLPPVTNLIFNASENTASSVARARAGSTESRAKTYRATLKRIPDKPIFGHKVEGEQATEGPTVLAEGSRIGSHSFIMGDLLYQKGLLGLGIFATFWTSLLAWFYKTRRERPMCWFPILALFSLQSVVTTLQFSMTMGTLLCMLIRQPSQTKLKPLSRSGS